MTKTRIVLIRHGESNVTVQRVLGGPRTCSGLSDLGKMQAERLRAEAAQVRAHIAGLAPEHWIVKRERAFTLWREGKWAEAIALTREIMDGGPMSYERAYPYTELIFSVGHLDETVAVVEQLKTIEPLAMFISRDLQYDYTAARRIDDAEAGFA